MFNLRYLAISLLVALSVLSPFDARYVKRRPQSDDKCISNSDCLQKGLPPLPPRRAGRQRTRRQDSEFAPVAVTTCGTASTVFLPKGTYTVVLAGASGASTSSNSGGLGAVQTASITVGANTTVGYFVGCAGRAASGVGAGGGGTFLYYTGPNAPAILVSGGGGGGGVNTGGPGRNAGTSQLGVATLKDGSDGAQMGSGGPASTDSNSRAGGPGGGGFISAGATPSGSASGGSQSINYGGTFAGGTTFGSGTTGGAGGGGGAGFFGGGGGGGYSGGGGGDGSLANPNGGGGGGGSYTNPATDGAVVVDSAAITVATSRGSGSLSITKMP